MDSLVANATNAFPPGGSHAPPSVLLVEDESSIAEPFAQALRRNGFQPTIASTGGEALELARTSSPQIVLLDLALPDIDGRDVCRTLRAESDVPIIIVTSRGTVTDRIVGLELGADDYIVKPFATAEAISRIKAVLRRYQGRGERLDGATDAAGAGSPADSTTGATEAAGRPKPISVRGLTVDPASRRATLNGEEVELTRKELDLLIRLMQDAGRVLTRETLMSEVWDENWFGSTKTLDVHIASLRRKLGDPSFIDTVRGVGFRFAEPEGSEP